MEVNLQEELVALLRAVTAPNAGALVENLTRLDAALARARPDLHPQLAHFLERRSYAKALMFLEGRADIPAGVCGGGKAPVGGGKSGPA